MWLEPRVHISMTVYVPGRFETSTEILFRKRYRVHYGGHATHKKPGVIDWKKQHATRQNTGLKRRGSRGSSAPFDLFYCSWRSAGLRSVALLSRSFTTLRSPVIVSCNIPEAFESPKCASMSSALRASSAASARRALASGSYRSEGLCVEYASALNTRCRVLLNTSGSGGAGSGDAD
jgi:hypothetical protein